MKKLMLSWRLKDEVDGIVTTTWVPAVVATQALTNMGDKKELKWLVLIMTK